MSGTGLVQPFGSETFDQNARVALADTQLRSALRYAMDVFGERRRGAIAATPDWQGMRTRARAIKDETLLHLDRYLEEFVANAERAGATVHWARDADEACAVVARVARSCGARSIVKSKSMATEEIHLNAALAAAGVEAIETDLGEYIVQLAGETPSHVVAPAIHKSKKQVADLFADVLGIERTEDASELTLTARKVLRDHFASAGMGISGANFGVAETGTIVIVENEGNARLSTSVPPVHLAVMGIEKLIPRFADLDLMLKVLTRSGTGQQITSYVSLITGVKRAPEHEGPRELHIVLLDNGRSRMLAHPVTRQSLACIRCGACLNVCPVFHQIGGHAYGTVYPGPIGAVITPQLVGLASTSQLPYASSLCGACREACPVKIDIPELLLHLRAAVVENGTPATRAAGTSQASVPRRGLGEALAFRAYGGVMRRPRLLRWVTRAARSVQRVAPKAVASRGGPAAGNLVPPLGAWTAWRDLRPLAPRSFRDMWASGLDGDDR